MIDRHAYRGIELDVRLPLSDHPGLGHNRWHPDLPPALTVQPGEPFFLDLIDASDAVVGRDNPSQPWDHSRIHPLTGPVAVDGARPGDLVEVRVLNVVTGSHGVTSARPGQGLLGHLIDQELYAVWELGAHDARSAQLPGVRIPARSFPGCLGVAPSHSFLRENRRREEILAGRGAKVAIDRSPGAIPPQAHDGLRTMPPRANGGNMDTPQLSKGSRAFFEVQVPGGLISAGDLHYAQGEGEVGSSAIETSGTVLLEARLHAGRGALSTNPIIAHEPPRRGPRITATGQAPVDAGSSDLHAAARAAVENLANLVGDVTGLTLEQLSILFSVAADLGIAQVYNHPFPTVTATLPVEVFAEHPSWPRWQTFVGN